MKLSLLLLVICHDDENWFGTISEMTFSMLNEIDIASKWSPDNGITYPLKDQGHRIATLQQVFDEFATNPEIYFFLDLKSLYVLVKEKWNYFIIFLIFFCRNISEKVFKIVESYQIMDRIIIGAMDETINTEMMTHKPQNVPSTSSLNDAIRVF